MRVISGILKGKVIPGYEIEGTRPTKDRIKESMFAMIQDYLKDAVFLDLFAGSGSIGIEALSNGAKKVYFIDNNHICINNIKQFIKTTNLYDKGVYLKQTAQTFINQKSPEVTFDIIFIDPPYNYDNYELLLEQISVNQMLNEKGIIVIEHDNHLQINPSNFYILLKQRKYGSTYISILTKKSL